MLNIGILCDQLFMIKNLKKNSFTKIGLNFVFKN